MLFLFGFILGIALAFATIGQIYGNIIDSLCNEIDKLQKEKEFR